MILQPKRECSWIQKGLTEFGTSNLRSALEYQRRIDNPTLRTSMDHIDNGSKLYFVDTETSGIARGDMVRSVSIRETTLDTSTRTINTTGTVDLGARFNTPGMSAYVAADPSGLNRVTSLGEAVIRRETDMGTRLTSELPKFDLATSGGRTEAAKFYKAKFQLFSEGDAFFVAYNAKFDVSMLADSARMIPEFMNDKASVELLERFETRMANGGVVDILEMVKSSLGGQVSERVKASVARGDDVGATALEAVQSLLSPQALFRAGMVGEAVRPFGLENILESTDLLERIARRGDTEGLDLIKTLSSVSGSHIDEVDNTVTRLLAKEMLTTDRNSIKGFRSGLWARPRVNGPNC